MESRKTSKIDGKPLTGFKVVGLCYNREMARKCTKCGVEKDDVQFQYGKATRANCRECHNKWRREAKERYEKDAEKITKTCTNCKEEKKGTEFVYSSLICKKCTSERDKEENNRPAPDAPPKTCSKCEKEQLANQFRHRSKTCLTCEKEQLYVWREKNPEKFKKICKSYREKSENKEKRATYLRDKYATDMNFRLERLYRTRVRGFIKGGVGVKGKAKYEKMLGCSWDTLREWLQSNFAEGMTWENYGTTWHVDHTMPCAVFDFTIEENVKSCFNWSNLSPMFGPENMSKSDKVNMSLVAKIKEKARTFIVTNQQQILTEALPADLRASSGVLDTKVSVKADTGSGEKPEVR